MHQVLNTAPDFYSTRPGGADRKLRKQGKLLQAQLERLVKTTEQDVPWAATITEDQINGWLIGELPTRFPSALPSKMRDPRIAIEPGRLKVACQYRHGNMQAVLTLEAESFVTERPNELGIRIIDARIGAVPGLTDKAMQAITSACGRAKLPIRWIDRGPQPKAVIRLSRDLRQRELDMRLEHIAISDGTVSVAAKWVPRKAPQLPVDIMSYASQLRSQLQLLPDQLRREAVDTDSEQTSQPVSRQLEMPRPISLHER
jgi:hypothetical protein